MVVFLLVQHWQDVKTRDYSAFAGALRFSLDRYYRADCAAKPTYL